MLVLFRNNLFFVTNFPNVGLIKVFSFPETCMNENYQGRISGKNVNKICIHAMEQVSSLEQRNCLHNNDRTFTMMLVEK